MYNTELFTAKAIEMLETRNESRPIFLYLACLAVGGAVNALAVLYTCWVGA